MQQHIFSFVSDFDELQNNAPLPASSHCSSVQERLVTYGSEALDTFGRLLSLEMSYHVVNHLQVDLLEGPQRLGDLAFAIQLD
jgi:hypothetical protein